MKCPLCARGILLEWTAGVYCSKRYAARRCSFEVGVAATPAEWETLVADELARKRRPDRRKKRAA